ncbi:hypothetical protein VTK73DRAFT_9052 [Phialemonium thermophilum]|uniref:Uncharacterized protein n=1 Tax=Phialemonium thermophilum TaxID=223376 RepID=A0ABR3W525_9PEZI
MQRGSPGCLLLLRAAGTSRSSAAQSCLNLTPQRIRIRVRAVADLGACKNHCPSAPKTVSLLISQDAAQQKHHRPALNVEEYTIRTCLERIARNTLQEVLVCS